MSTQALLQKYSQVFVPGSYQARFARRLKERRQEHLETLLAEKSPCVFWGLDIEPGHENIWMMNGLRIFQEPAVLWLTGINQTGIRLVLDPLASKRKSKSKVKFSEVVLFVPSKDPSKEFWDGARFGLTPPDHAEFEKNLQEIQNLTGINDVRLNSEFDQYVADLNSKNVLGFYHDYRGLTDLHHPARKLKSYLITTDHNFEARQTLQKFLKKKKQSTTLSPWAWQHYMLRLPLDKGQVKDARKAQAITLEAFKNTLSELPKFKSENDLGRFLEYQMLKESTAGLAFPSIVAGAKNATVLHYLKNDEKLKKGSMVLLDFGARVGTQHCDISRTIPVSGKYNPLQKLLYDICLEAQTFHQKNVRPGRSINDVTQSTWMFLENLLFERFFAHGGIAKREYDRAGIEVTNSNAIRDGLVKPHGISHLMGEQEHDGDPVRIYGAIPMREGWMISNEPGIYGHFTIKLQGKKYSDWIGIRLEDDLLLTKTGCVNLSKNFPHTTDEIEACIDAGSLSARETKK